MRTFLLVVGLASLASWWSCTPAPALRVCSPGSSQTCSALGCVGVQRCNATGTAYESCSCMGTGAGGPGPGGGGSATGGGSAGGGLSGGGAGGGGASGGGGATGCSPATCSGCCNGSQCVLPPNNANNGTCGVNGVACVNCSASGQLCNPIGFTCMTGAGGGAAGGGSAGGGGAGGGSTCDGCRLANGTCQPRGTNRQNNSICGSFGQPCMACPGGTVCDFGACVTAPRAVGDSCVSNADCQATLGPSAVCLQSNLSGSITLPGGMCTIENCSGTTLCPAGSACLNFPRIYGFERSACYPTGCQTNSCRAGFTCLTVDPSTALTSCLPAALTTPNLPLDTTSVVGTPCTLNSDCRAPTFGAPAAGGLCISELRRFADGGLVMPTQTSGFTGGYCSRDCRSDEDCTSTGLEDTFEGLCLPTSNMLLALCYRGCGNPGQGQGTCRSGYVCGALTLRDGGMFASGVCEPRCDVPGRSCTSPRTCNTATGYCQ